MHTTDAPLRKQSPSHERLTTASYAAVSLVESTSLLFDGLQSTATSNDNAYIIIGRRLCIQHTATEVSELGVDNVEEEEKKPKEKKDAIRDAALALLGMFVKQRELLL